MDKKSLNKDQDEDSTSENVYLTSILSILNGYCKINLEVQQVNLFYSKDSLLPINANVHSSIYNYGRVQSVQKLKINTDTLKNEENIETAYLPNSLNKPNLKFQACSKPFNSNSIFHRDKSTIVVPKGTKRKNIYVPSTSNNQLVIPSLCTDQDDNEKLEIDLRNQQDKVKILLFVYRISIFNCFFFFFFIGNSK